jgi:hypothetical protein
VIATVSTVFGESFKFRLLLLDLTPDSIQLFADIECVLYGLRLLHNGQVLRFLRAQITQMGVLVDILLCHILRFQLLAFHSQLQLANFGAHFCKACGRNADGERSVRGILRAILFCEHDARSKSCDSFKVTGSKSGILKGKTQNTV